MDSRGKLKWENWLRVSKVQAGYYRRLCMPGGKETYKVTFSSYFLTSKYSPAPSTIPGTFPTSCAGRRRTACRADPILVRADPIHPSSNFLLPTIPCIAPSLVPVIKGAVSIRGRGDGQPVGETWCA